MGKKKKHEDTTISLQPLTFEEAIKELAKTPKRGDPQAGETGNTNEVAPESGTSKPQSVPHRESSGD